MECEKHLVMKCKSKFHVWLSWNFVLSKDIIFKSLRCFYYTFEYLYYNKVSKWLNANLSTNNGGSGV
jgi:hypothetical protein